MLFSKDNHCPQIHFHQFLLHIYTNTSSSSFTQYIFGNFKKITDLFLNFFFLLAVYLESLCTLFFSVAAQFLTQLYHNFIKSLPYHKSFSLFPSQLFFCSIKLYCSKYFVCAYLVQIDPQLKQKCWQVLDQRIQNFMVLKNYEIAFILCVYSYMITNDI